MCIKHIERQSQINKRREKQIEKYKSRLRALINPKISFKSKRKFLVQKGGFMVPLLASVLSGVIGSLISNNNN